MSFQNYGGNMPPSNNGNKQAPEKIGMVSDIVAVVATVLSWGTLGFLISLGFWLYGKDKTDPINRSALKNSVNIQLTMLIGIIISALLMVVGVGFILLPIVVIAGCSLHVIDAMNANNNNYWTPPYIFNVFK